MKTIATENRIPTHIAALYGGSRNFRILMRQKVAQARKAMASFDTLGSFTFADRGKEVAYRIVAGCRVTRGHKDPDGLPCGGVVDEDE